MANAPRIAARATVGLLLSVALLLMHGGIGQAMACTGAPVTAMTSMSMSASASTEDGTPVNNAPSSEQSQHQKPTQNPTAAHHSQMCLSTAVGADGGGTKAGPSVVAVVLPRAALPAAERVRVGRPAGRHPPTPDPISVLCVNRR